VSKSTRLKAQPITTREQMEALVREIATLQVRRQRYTAELNDRITQIRADYEGANAAIDSELKGKMALAQEWADSHPAEFGKTRSIAMTHGDVGWRLGNPALKTISRWTWERVLDAISASSMFNGYVRVKREVNKQALLDNREMYSPEQLKTIGVQVVQEDTFYIEPRLDTVEPKLQEAA
jgi:phage host-nuclease inhibitor protein Gam